MSSSQFGGHDNSPCRSVSVQMTLSSSLSVMSFLCTACSSIYPAGPLSINWIKGGKTSGSMSISKKLKHTLSLNLESDLPPCGKKNTGGVCFNIFGD